MESHTQVVVIGGGATGCSVLYHLAKLGWTDVVLLERQELTAGSSWHAAGIVFSLTAPSNVAALQKYTIELYPELEKESGQSCGYHPTGGFHAIRDADELEAYRLAQSCARRNGIETDWISLEEAQRRAPIFNPGPFVAALWEELKGYVDPASVTQAYAAAARNRGAKIYRQTPVLETNPLADGGWEVVTPQGTLRTEYVVNAAGLWAREVAALAGIRLPLMPVEHHYLVTETIPAVADMDAELPGISDSAVGNYFRQEGQGLLVGNYERRCQHWAVDGTPLDFGHELLPDDLGRLEEGFAHAVEAFPCLSETGIKRVINGPMIFSPDLGPLLGPYPGLPRYFCACGVMTAFSQAGGIGRTVAEWIVDGEPSLDVSFWDVARFGDWADLAWTRARTKYFYEHRSDIIYPYEEIEAGRPANTTPVHAKLEAAGALFGESFGEEYPLWFARPGEERVHRPSFRRANWFEAVGEECRATRESVGLLEISSFAKFEVRGHGAEAWLNRILANRMPARVGRTVLSPMLSGAGRVIGDFTATRLGTDRFLLLGTGQMQIYYRRHFERFLPADGVEVVNRSKALAGLHVAGPNARALLSSCSEEDFSSEALPFLSGRVLSIGEAAEVIAIRISFTGELGYELYCPLEQEPALYDALLAAGKPFGLRQVGMHALMSLRLEKSFPSWGLELSPDYSVFEAGLERFVKLDKPDFIGRQAVLSQQLQAPREQRITLSIDVADVDAVGGEAIFNGEERVGYVSSAGYGHCVEQSIALGYVRPRAVDPERTYAVEILGELRSARLHAQPLFDPTGSRLRS